MTLGSQPKLVFTLTKLFLIATYLFSLILPSPLREDHSNASYEIVDLGLLGSTCAAVVGCSEINVKLPGSLVSVNL